MSQDEFVAKVYSKNPNFEILSEYKGTRKNILRKCKICGDVREVQARMLLSGRNCPICAAKKTGLKSRKTNEQFIAEMREINPNIKILTSYVTNDKKVLCKCLIDGFEWEGVPHVLLQGHGCPECYRRIANRRTESEFLEEMKKRFPTIQVLSKYERTAIKVKFRCFVCGYEWEAVPNTLLNNKNPGCPKCSHRIPVTEEEFIERLNSVNNKIEYKGGFNGMLKKIPFKCKECGYEWENTPNAIVNQYKGCPKCLSSHGEKRIINYLESKGIEYKRQYSFEDCAYIKSLRFDFFIPLANIAIEYDGQQHFMPIKFGGKNDNNAEFRFEETKRRDNIKNQYCKSNDIKLIRIPYTDFNKIEEILDNYLFPKQKWRRVFGISGRVGLLDSKGTPTVYQNSDDNAERIHLMLKNYTFGYCITKPENFAKITFSA